METQSASVEIALKPSVGKTLPNNIQAIIQNEYASRYLESIGANPSKENMDLMLKSLPLKEALILPVWQREAIVIMPGVAKNADINAIMHQLVNSNLEKARGETDGGGTAAEEDTAKKKSPKKLDFSPRKKVNTKEVAFKHVDITHPKKENHARDNRKLSWCTVNTPDVLDDFVDRISVRDAATNHFKNLLLPMGLIKTQILQSVHCFNLSLDGFLLETNVNNKRVLELNVQSLLGSSSCIRLYDILIRFCYWSIIHPTARKVIIAAKKEDPSCFPEHIMTTANAKRESMAYLRHEIYLKKKKEQELLASREKVESLEEEGTLNSGRDRTHSHEMDEGGVGTDAEVGFDGAVEPMDSMIQISEDGFGLDQPDSAVTAELSATASETSLDMQEREELFLQLEKCRHIIHRELDSCELSVAVAMQALVSCCHYVVDDVIAMLYPWFETKSKHKYFESIHLSAIPPLNSSTKPRNSNSKGNNEHSGVLSSTSSNTREGTVSYRQRQTMKNNLSPTSFNDLYSEPADNILKLRLQMKRLMHQAMSDVLDPSRLFTSTLLKKSCVQTPLDKDPVKSYAQRGNAAGHITRAGTAPLPSKSKPNNICETRDVSTPLTHSKYFTTSIGVRAIYENAASDPATRRLLRRSATTPYVSIPGLKNPKYEGQDSLIDTSNWNDRHESVLTDDFEASIEFPKKFPQNDVEEVSTNAFPRSSRGCTADSLHSPIKTSRFGAGTRAGTADTASTSRKVSAAALSFAKTPESHGIPSGSSRIRRDLKRSFRTTAEMNIRPNYDYSLAKTKELSKMESAIASAKYLYGDEYLENNRELLQQTAKNSELKHEEDVLVDAQVDTATPLVIPQPYFETKQHNRYTRSLDEAKLSLQAYRNSRGALSERYANSFEMKEENENPEEALPTLYPTADKIVNKSFLVRTVDAVKYANDNKVESAPQNHYYFDPADFIKYRTGSSAGKLGKTEETALEKIQRLKEEADVKASNLSKNTSSIAKTRASIQVILEQRRAKMLENTDTTPSDKKKNVRANVAFTSTVNNEKHPTIKLPTKKLKVPKLSEYETIPLSNEGRCKLLDLAVDRTSMQYSKRHLARHSRTPLVLERMSLLNEK